MRNPPEGQCEPTPNTFDQLWQQFSDKLRAQLPKEKVTAEQLPRLTRLASRYASEIAEAFEKKGGYPPPNTTKYIVLVAMARFDSALKNAPASLESEHMRRSVVKKHVRAVIDEYLVALDEWVSQATSLELLLLLLSIPQPAAEQLMGRLSYNQAYETLALHLATVTGRRHFSYRPLHDQTPKNYLDWVALRLYDRIKGLLGHSLEQDGALFFWWSDRPIPAKNKDGQPINFADPLNAKIIEKWDREMNKHGRLKDDSWAKGRIASAGRIADSLSPSAKEIRRYLKEDVPVKLSPNDKGGVYIELTDDSILASIEAVEGQKPGRKPKHTP
jgi:hypothetical protein